MDNPGIVNFGDFGIGAAGTQLGTAQIGLQGVKAMSLFARFAYGSGGTTARVFFQTSLDQGVTWIDVACILFTTAGDVRVENLSGLTPKTTPSVITDGALADNTCLDGILGDTWRTKVVTTGTYAGGTLLSLRGQAR
jgi:hypothetical protein